MGKYICDIKARMLTFAGLCVMRFLTHPALIPVFEEAIAHANDTLTRAYLGELDLDTVLTAEGGKAN